MTLREKIGHLYRRFGLGATPADLDEGMKLGVDGTLKKLIDYETTDEGFNVSPYEFVWRMDKNGTPDVDLSSSHYRAWWVMRMLATKRPLQEKLVLFWHNHFAVSDGKVEDGSMMLQYLDVLRQDANTTFPKLVQQVSKNPAMMRYLDMNRSIKGHPNENFPREVMELFTLGIGNYTEKDIQEVSRAMTGWGFINIYNDRKGTPVEKLMESIQYDRPFTSFCYMPDMHDTTPKMILGQTANWDGDGVLDMLSKHTITAHRMTKKLWEFFAYEDPEPALIDKLSKVWVSSGGDIKKVLYAMAKANEFWGPKAVRTMIKSPVDLCIPIARQMGTGEAMLALRDPAAKPSTPIVAKVQNQAAYLHSLMTRQGLALLYPPDVSGWRWHAAWVSLAMMVERYRFQGVMLYDKGADAPLKNVYAFVTKTPPKDTRAVVDSLLEFFDLPLPEGSRKVVVEELDKLGGLKAMANANQFGRCYTAMMHIIMAAPEAQFC